jgi:tight adherence protein B
MDLLYYGCILLLFIALASEVLWGWWFSKLSTKAKRLNKRLLQVTSKNADTGRDTAGLLKSRRLAQSDRVDLLLQRLPGVYRLHAYLMQAGLSWSVSQFLAMGMIIALVSFLCLELLPISIGMVMALSIIASLTPWVYVIHKRARRLLLLEEQLPEMADFISRSLRAGHAFSVSL